jgi:nucleoid DNA-binding protein
VTKKDLSRAIAEDMGLTQVRSREVVQQVFDGMTETLVQQGRIELRNFGVFEVKRRKPRRARNSRTRQTAAVPARLVVTLKAGREMAERVGQLTQVPAGGDGLSACRSCSVTRGGSVPWPLPIRAPLLMTTIRRDVACPPTSGQACKPSNKLRSKQARCREPWRTRRCGRRARP